MIYILCFYSEKLYFHLRTISWSFSINDATTTADEKLEDTSVIVTHLKTCVKDGQN
jgi:hypothetical protein